MAVLPIRGQVLLEAHLETRSLASALEERRVGRHPIDPSAERRPSLEGVDLAREREEDILHYLFGILVGAGDAAGHSKDPGGIALYQVLERRRVAAPEAIDQESFRGWVHISAPAA